MYMHACIMTFLNDEKHCKRATCFKLNKRLKYSKKFEILSSWLGKDMKTICEIQ